MRWPLGIKTTTKTAEEYEARIKALQTQRLQAEGLTRRTPEEQAQRMRSLEDQLGHAKGEISYREQMLADGGRDLLEGAFHQQLLAESYRQQAREGWVVMQTFTPFPVKVLKLSERAQHLVRHAPEPVLAFGDSLPPISPAFRTLTLKRGEGYINDVGELVVCL